MAAIQRDIDQNDHQIINDDKQEIQDTCKKQSSPDNLIRLGTCKVRKCNLVTSFQAALSVIFSTSKGGAYSK
jgi:hypothetical protein